ASIREKVVYGASHLLQWEMIKWMMAHGAEVYDLCGTPPSDRIHDPTHPFAGLARFKTSFNKHVTDYVGCYNLPVKPLRYKLWKTIVERAVLRLHRLRNHTEWY
ncbi:MAG TPA: peptidoglycan bridge formation glycyltransferase FemA/FemB family protein, partial [Candidatus Saccharimonadaceae bacterium]|nr:peptidoglycan bridge formation glycyltransferase FemA/FemB family protein [Candidatus Saccharimonadaceae bacterium]